MALGGGTFVVENKVLPGAYINFISLASASSALSERGIATMALELDWGIENEVFTVNSADFKEECFKIFGLEYDDVKLKGVRDLLRNVVTLYAYRLNSGGKKAENTFATAKYGGLRGNDIKITIKKNVDQPSLFDVETIVGTKIVDTQTVAAATNLIDNDFVVFKKGAALSVVSASPLTAGTNGTVDGSSHQNYLNKIEAYSFNSMGAVTTEDNIKTVYESFCKRMRDEVGAKFQLVLYNKSSNYEGIINVKNTVIGDAEASLVYWVTGIAAGCAVNKSNLNRIYDGEFVVSADYTQTQLAKSIEAGEFTLHKVGPDIRVLEDINSLVTTTSSKGEIFKDNQTIRVIDQIANDIAVLFNTKYLGSVPNDESGRVSLWSDIVKHHEQLQNIRAIEGFSDKDVVVKPGASKKSVIVSDAVTVVSSMAKLYMTVTVA